MGEVRETRETKGRRGQRGFMGGRLGGRGGRTRWTRWKARGWFDDEDKYGTRFRVQRPQRWPSDLWTWLCAQGYLSLRGEPNKTETMVHTMTCLAVAVEAPLVATAREIICTYIMCKHAWHGKPGRAWGHLTRASRAGKSVKSRVWRLEAGNGWIKRWIPSRQRDKVKVDTE